MLAPIDGPEQVPLVVGAGATELYCGYIPDDWRTTYNRDGGPAHPIQMSLNRRESRHSNLTRLEELLAVVGSAHAKGVPVYITVNFAYYPDFTYPYMLDFCRHILGSGADGLIIADPGLISAVRESIGDDVKVILSTCTQVASAPAVELFRRLGVQRITFPRHIALAEIERITRAVPDIGYEVFILEGRCTYDDGNCNILHCGGSFCMEELVWDIWRADGGEPSWEETTRLRTLQGEYRRWTYPFANDLKNASAWRNMGCGICSLPFLLRRTGVTALKLAGRGIDNLQKLKSLWLLRKALNLARNGAGSADIRELVSQLPDCREECVSGYRCYFPDWRQEEA